VRSLLNKISSDPFFYLLCLPSAYIISAILSGLIVWLGFYLNIIVGFVVLYFAILFMVGVLFGKHFDL